MSAMSSPSSKRPLRKGRLPADVYPQDAKQREDELSLVTLKQGFSYNPVSGDQEHGSIKSGNLSTALVTNYFSALLAKKEELSIQPDSIKKRPVLNNNKDQFFAVSGKASGKASIDGFFKELTISKPAQILPKKIPLYNKKEEVLQALYDYSVAYFKAAWYIKLMAAYSASQTDSKVKKRQNIGDPCFEWTQAILKSLRELLQKLSEFYRISSCDKNEPNNLPFPSGLAHPGPDRPDYETLIKQWKYIFGLTEHLYEEGLIDHQEVCYWLVDMTEKARSSGDGGLLKLIVPSLLHFLPDILTSEILSRKLAGTSAKYLASICQSATPNGTATAKWPVRLLEEALECSHHGVPVRGVIGILQLIAMQNPSACMWISLGDDRSSCQSEGSPLDFLPVCPSELPVSPSVATLYPDFKERIKQTEEEIRNRSMLVESKWLSPKTTSDMVIHVSMCLQALEALDREAFHRQDPPDSSDKHDLDSLYNNVFKSVSRDLSSDTWRSDVEPLIFFLCRWSTTTRRTGIHRGVLIACLLDKFQTELSPQLPPLDPASSSSHFIFQDLLMKYLDEEGPKFESHGRPQDVTVLESTVLLFSQLISRAVFSHDEYICALIGTGLVSQAPVNRRPNGPFNLGPAESPLSQQQHEPSYYMQPSPAGSLTASAPASLNNYEIPTPASSLNYGVFAGAGGEDYLRKNAVPQSSGAYGFMERKTAAVIPQSPYHQYQAMNPPFARPPPQQHQQQQQQQQHHLYDEPASAQSTDFSSMDGTYDKSSSVSSILSDIAPPPGTSNMSAHYYYVLHFPISGPTGQSSHELNQRAILLYGFGQAREQARLTTKQIIKDTEKLFGKKSCIDVHEGRRPSRPAVHTGLRERFLQLAYFDRHVVSEAAVKVLIKRLSAVSLGTSPYLPTWENIQFAMELLEGALNISSLLSTITEILRMLRPLEKFWTPSNTNNSDNSRQMSFQIQSTIIPTLMLICVSLLRKYHCCLLLAPRQAITTFETLRESVLNVSNPASCTSAERCVLAYIYDLYHSAGFLKDHFEEVFTLKGNSLSPCEQIKNTIMAKLSKVQSQERRWEKEFMREYLANPTERPPPELLKQLTASPALQRSFVVNAILAIKAETDLDKVNDIAIFCAEMTAVYNGLTLEWIMAFRALCNLFLPNTVYRYEDHLGKLDISDGNFHERLAILCCILIGRHALRLEMIIGNVAMMKLMVTSRQLTGLRESRLATHIMLRLLQGVPEDSSSSIIYLKYPWDRSLLVASRSGLAVAPLLAILKAMLVLSDAKITPEMNEEHHDSPSPEPRAHSRPYGWNTEGLSDFARMALLDICQEDSVRSCVLRRLETLFSLELLLDPIMTREQTRNLVDLLCHPKQLALTYLEESLDDRQTMQRSLRNLDQWNLRVCWVEIKLLLDHPEAKPEERNRIIHELLDVFAKAVVEAFQVTRGEDKSISTGSVQSKKASKTQLVRFELDTGDHTWYIAPLICKLDLSVQQRVLRQATQLMENCTWSTKPKDREKMIKSTLLLGYAPFMTIITSCLNQNRSGEHHNDQKESLLLSLYNQLSQFAKEDRVFLAEDARYRPLLMEALSLRLSLAGSLLELIQKQMNYLSDWAFLLAQLIISGCVEPVESQELFQIVFDFLTVLIHTALAIDQPAQSATDKTEDRKIYANIQKKIRKEIGDKMTAGVEYLKMVLPLAKKSLDIIAVEPIGTVKDAKGNKSVPPVPFESGDRKHGLQVRGVKESMDPWDVLEGFRNPYPLPWSFFNAIKMDRKTLTAEIISQQMSWHSHLSPKPIEYFLDPPPLPAEEDVPERTAGEEPANSETASVDTASPRSPRSRQPARSKKAANQASKKRTRSPATTMQQFLPSQTMPMGFGQDTGMLSQSPGWYNQPQQVAPPAQRGYHYSTQPGSYGNMQHMEMNRQRMTQPDQRPQARPYLQNMLHARHAASQPQQTANPTLNYMLNGHPGQPAQLGQLGQLGQPGQPQRSSMMQKPMQMQQTSIMPGNSNMPMPQHQPMSYGPMRPPLMQQHQQHQQHQSNTNIMPDQAGEFAIKQQMRIHHQQQQHMTYQSNAGGGYAPQTEMTPSDGQALYSNDQQTQNNGPVNYQQQPVMYRQANNMPGEYLQQQYHQQQQQQQRTGPRQ